MTLSERIALHQSTVDSAVDTPTFAYLGRGQYRCSVCGLVNVQPTTAGVPRCDGPHATLRVDPASGDVVPYRAPWRDNLTARDETFR